MEAKNQVHVHHLKGRAHFLPNTLGPEKAYLAEQLRFLPVEGNSAPLGALMSSYFSTGATELSVLLETDSEIVPNAFIYFSIYRTAYSHLEINDLFPCFFLSSLVVSFRFLLRVSITYLRLVI